MEFSVSEQHRLRPTPTTRAALFSHSDRIHDANGKHRDRRGVKGRAGSVPLWPPQPPPVECRRFGDSRRCSAAKQTRVANRGSSIGGGGAPADRFVA